MCKFVAILESTVHVCNKHIISENIIYDYYLYMHMHCDLKIPYLLAKEVQSGSLILFTFCVICYLYVRQSGFCFPRQSLLLSSMAGWYQFRNTSTKE